ncbi:MAG: 4Fe-4S dicluster domain-containing protein [Desulfobacteraceae bacterium]|nr:MAG: 4Fe-4S dicluster domain-containing protein [Desulfobacteraceae bacterium]
MIRIDKEKCRACGVCGRICPRYIPETIEHGDIRETVLSTERIGLCMECGHCEALCPSGAIHVDSFSGRFFEPVKKPDITEGQLLALLKQRRSIRRYKDEPVPRNVLNRIIEAAHSAPTGTGSQSTGVLVIDNPGTLKSLSAHFYSLYRRLEKALANPVARFIIQKKKGKKILNILRNFVMPGMHWYIKWHDAGRSDEILRDCPVLILFYSPDSEPMGEDNCTVAAYHAILMAEVLGVGTCFNHLIPPACNEDPEVKQILNLPQDCDVYVGLTAGYPKYSFKRIVPRRLAEVRYL